MGKFWSRVWSVPRPLFCLPLIAKRCTGDEVAPWRLHKKSVRQVSSWKFVIKRAKNTYPFVWISAWGSLKILVQNSYFQKEFLEYVGIFLATSQSQIVVWNLFLRHIFAFFSPWKSLNNAPSFDQVSISDTHSHGITLQRLIFANFWQICEICFIPLSTKVHPCKIFAEIFFSAVWVDRRK